MATSATRDSLRAIVDWLEGNDDTGWEGQIEAGEQCRSDMERLARPDYRRGRSSGLAPDHDPKLNRAIPHVRAMLTAMQSRKRAAALEHGKVALAAL